MTFTGIELTDEEIAEALCAVDEQEFFPAPSNPMAVARRLLPRWTHRSGHHTLRYWRGQWMRWEGSHWREVSEAELTSELYRALEHAEFLFVDARGDESIKPWAPTKSKVSDVLAALAAIVHLSERVDAPSWLDGAGQVCSANSTIIACGNGLLDLAADQLHDHTPTFFNTVAVPFDYDPHAPAPTRWLGFVGQLWPDDAGSVDLLQEIFGYILSGRTDLQKIALLVGPTRSGKGTIARVLRCLVGAANVAGPTLNSLGANFGLSTLLGKSLAIVSDARLAGPDRHMVVERLLTISGEDTIDVDRKYRPVWTGKLGTRLMILSNELPNFGDASGAIANRFRVLTLTRSWLGKEDSALTDRLTAELPGILNWALAGLARLNAQGQISEPGGSQEAVLAMQELGSPTAAFLRDCCTVEHGESVAVDVLWERWKTWCDDNGHRSGSKQTLSRNLAAASAAVRIYRPHGQARRFSSLALRAEVSESAPPRPALRPAEPLEPLPEPLAEPLPMPSDDPSELPEPHEPHPGAETVSTSTPPWVARISPGENERAPSAGRDPAGSSPGRAEPSRKIDNRTG